MNGVHINRFEFDYDTTWNSFFLDADLNVYSRYGGRDAGEPDARLNKESLIQTMNEVLEVHANREARQAAGEAVFQTVDPDVKTPEDMPLLQQNHRGCIHCHQVREYGLLQSFHDGQFTRRELFPFPLPENLGVNFDLQHGHRIDQVEPGSPAEQADLKPGDVITQVNNVPVHSEYDFRWALHRAADQQPLAVKLERQAKAVEVVTTNVTPTGPWRETNVGWRKSLRSVPFPLGVRGYSLSRSQRRELELPQDKMALRVVSIRENRFGYQLGLRRLDTIVSVAGDREFRSFAEFVSELLHHYTPGDKVEVTVLREGEEHDLSGEFPDWFIEESTVP